MPNTYFRFKEFTIHQDNCAMKVCTDSCLFGAWTADVLLNEKRSCENILDIGAGTGLLSLLLAQKIHNATFDAVEIAYPCYKRAESNILNSPWKQRIQVYNADIVRFGSEKRYDVIISNPPFYESDLAAKSTEKNIAHHNAGLTLQSFVTVAGRLMSDDGCLAVLLPHKRMYEFENIANGEGLFIKKKTLVKQTPHHSCFRVMFLLSREKTTVTENEIIIKEQDDKYSEVFTFLLKDYYLHL